MSQRNHFKRLTVSHLKLCSNALLLRVRQQRGTHIPFNLSQRAVACAFVWVLSMTTPVVQIVKEQMTSQVDVPVTHTLTHANTHTHTQFSTSSALHLGADTCSHGNTINGGATRVSKSFPPSASSSSSHRSWHLELSRCVPVHPSTIFFPGCTFSRSIDFSRSVSHPITHMQKGNAHTRTKYTVWL